MAHRIAAIPGDGIGNEVVPAGLTVMAAAARRFGFDLSWESFDYGADRYLRDGTTLPDADLAHLSEHFDCILLGAVGDPRVPGMEHARDIVLGTRTRLDLYVNLRPIKLIHESLCPLKGKGPRDVDFVVFRENTEGMYAGAGGFLAKGTPGEVAIQESINTRRGVERIVRAAFLWARAHDLGRVCMSDKHNALRYEGDLWYRTFREVARDFPEIEARHLYVDVLTMEMVRAPEQFRVVVTNNLFGDIVTDLGAQIQGGIGLAASANVNPETRRAMFEPVHGSAPDIAGTGRANPLATVLTVAMMLEHLGEGRAAREVEAAVSAAIAEGATTPDLGGSLTTDGVARWLCQWLERPETLR
ncbi:3-isopropylmalate dehydrogenase [Myxococcota bacterium]|nr:3-isopropylmalate dehydrogenase [Myxococcota bacterium]